MDSQSTNHYIQSLIDKIVSLSKTVDNLGAGYHIVEGRYADALNQLAKKENVFLIDAKNTNNLIGLSLVTVKSAKAAATISVQNDKLINALDAAIKAVELALAASDQEVIDSQSKNA